MRHVWTSPYDGLCIALWCISIDIKHSESSIQKCLMLPLKFVFKKVALRVRGSAIRLSVPQPVRFDSDSLIGYKGWSCIILIYNIMYCCIMAFWCHHENNCYAPASLYLSGDMPSGYIEFNICFVFSLQFFWQKCKSLGCQFQDVCEHILWSPGPSKY